MVESVRWRRLRWRLRGAWQWPAFTALTLVDAALLAWLPFQGEGADAAGALLLATFLNLFAVALPAPLLGWLLRRRRPDLPWFVARDYAGTALVALVTAALLAGGLAHRPGLDDERADERAVAVAVHGYVMTAAPRFGPGLEGVDVVRLEPDHYRACVHRAGEHLPLCLFVNTDQSPAGVRRDPSRDPNGR